MGKGSRFHKCDFESNIGEGRHTDLDKCNLLMMSLGLLDDCKRNSFHQGGDNYRKRVDDSKDYYIQ